MGLEANYTLLHRPSHEGDVPAKFRMQLMLS